MASCPICGIDDDTLSLHDATDAIRSFPRRYREALSDVPDELLRTRPARQHASMLELAAATREELELLAAVLPRVLAGGEPSFPTLDPAPPAAGTGRALTVDLVEAGISTACEALVASIDAVPLAAWDRRFDVDGVSFTARWIPGHAAHRGAHHLREIADIRELVAD